MVKFQFRGLLCPVFTPFTQDRKSINYTVIEKYAYYLNTKGVQGVLVNGITGEGTCLRVDERKRLAEEWLKVCRKYGMTMVLCIGGCPITDVYELCEHAEKIGVDCITLLPDLFYRPKIEEDLVEYIRNIVKHCPSRPIYYYHIPEYTDVYVDIIRFCKLAHKDINNFNGIFYGYNNIEQAHWLLKEGYHCIMTHYTLLTGLMTLGFDTFCLITLNIWPDHINEICDRMRNGKWNEGYIVFNKMWDAIKETSKTQNYLWDVVETFKTKFNTLVDFNVGEVRKPKLYYNKNY